MRLNEYFDRVSLRLPTRSAIYVKSRYYTYGEVSRYAKHLTRLIEEHDPAPTIYFGGIVCDKSVECYVAMLGILGSRKGYVPFNIRTPVTRNKIILERSRVRILVGDPECEELLRKLVADLELPLLVFLCGYQRIPSWCKGDSCRQHTFIIPNLHDQLPDTKFNDRSPGRFAYLLFTSGTTGTPKGVPISHENVCSFISDFSARYKIQEKDRIFHGSSITFDWSVAEIWSAWANGACLYVVPDAERLAATNFVETHKLTIWFSVPSQIRVMEQLRLLKRRRQPSLRLSFFCGEALLISDVINWAECAQNSTIINMYGPTEATVAVTAFECRLSELKSSALNNIVSVGKPFGRQRVVVVDDNLQEVPHGVLGEILILGTQVSPGYIDEPELNRASFLFSHPSYPSTQGYLTGDIGKFIENQLYYVGRNDEQIQVGGFRVELSEIEAAVGKLTNAFSVAAIGWPIIYGQPRGIVVFVVCNEDVDSAVLISELSKTLPTYMIPKVCHRIPGMPLNINGKVDKGRLAKLCQNSNLNRPEFTKDSIP
jgi:amino acid adenylation domain-containing protein